MNRPYFPTTDTIKECYAVGRDELDGMIHRAESFAEFDRWFASEIERAEERGRELGVRRPSDEERRLAAEIRVRVDKKQHRKTPEWISRLAKRGAKRD